MVQLVKQKSQNPLILRCHRMMEAFTKSDDERDFYLDRVEGFLVFVDLDKSTQELTALENELAENTERYCLIPKLTFYEAKKIMEGFVNEKVYDIDTKEKLLDIIQSKDARENFLEFLHDHPTELDKWQQYYQERSRVRIIEWLRANDFNFVFEEDLDLGKNVIEKLKKSLFETKVGKDVITGRKTLESKAKMYYSNEALNPKPKRGRPPKQIAKTEVEPQFTGDIYINVPAAVRPCLFTPDPSSILTIHFSSKFHADEKEQRRTSSSSATDAVLESLNQKLAALKGISGRWLATEAIAKEKEDQPPQEIQGSEEQLSFTQKHMAPHQKKPKDEKLKTNVTKTRSQTMVAKTTKKASVKKSPARKATPAKKVATKKVAAKKKPLTVRKTAAKKTTAKKAPARRTVAKKTTSRSKSKMC